MGKGYIEMKAAYNGTPCVNISVFIKDIYGKVLHRLQTDENGKTLPVSVDAPDSFHTLNRDDTGPFFSLVDVEMSAPLSQKIAVTTRNVPIFDGVTSTLPISLEPIDTIDTVNREMALPPMFGLQLPHEHPECPDRQNTGHPVIPGEYTLPESIVVHLGRPNTEADNIRVPFMDYVKTAASCELYPTWPEAALEANIRCIAGIAVSRVNSGWYRSQGYPFDITSSVSLDPMYIPGRPVFDTIAAITERVVTSYLAKTSTAQPLFTHFCNGVTSVCAGLSQWGSVALAKDGLSGLAILRHYFGPDIILAPFAPAPAPSYVFEPVSPIKKTAPLGAVIRWLLLKRFLTQHYPAPYVQAANCFSQ